jgi:hypothetical protein
MIFTQPDGTKLVLDDSETACMAFGFKPGQLIGHPQDGENGTVLGVAYEPEEETDVLYCLFSDDGGKACYIGTWDMAEYEKVSHLRA